MRKNRFRDYIRYRTDEILSRGTVFLILFLAALTALVLLLAGIAVILIESEWADRSLIYAIWKSFTLTLDAGNLAGIEGSVGLIFVTALVTLSGIFITSALIGIINTGLAGRLDGLKHGNAKVIEKGHTVILGFNNAIFSILSELQIANENQHRACVVVLGQEDKQLMEEQISRRVPKSKSTCIICRNGDTASLVDLEHCSVETCKSLIINDMDDLQVIRTLLAVSNYLSQPEIREGYPESKYIHVAASISQQENISVARIAGQQHAEVLYFNQVISRIMAHVSYQPGLSSVYMELFDFSGDEIYIEHFPMLGGRSFREAQLTFRKSVVIGVKHAGHFKLNPSPDTILDQNDCLILIVSDDGASSPSDQIPVIRHDLIRSSDSRFHLKAAERLLILGSNQLLPEILTELNVFLPYGSLITLASAMNAQTSMIKNDLPQFSNLNIEMQFVDTTARDSLEALLHLGFQHILILSDNTLPVDVADARTLAILLHIRDIAKNLDHDLSITSEMLDSRNQVLAQGTNVTDFVISSNITNLIMTQVSENRMLAAIFADLLDSEGSEIHLKPVQHYVQTGQNVNLFTVVEAVSRVNEVFIGYKIVDTDISGKTRTRIVTNPDKQEEVTFSERDWLIVLAED